jgi:hypothetical protein
MNGNRTWTLNALGFLAIAVLSGRIVAEPAPGAFQGHWEYRQAALPGEFDAEGEIISFTVKDGKLLGTYSGLERMGEHGLYYTFVDIDSIETKAGNGISFVIPARNFHAKRPKSKADLGKKEFQSAGHSNGRLRLTGALKEGRLVLECASATDECPEKRMVFRKGPWPGK